MRSSSSDQRERLLRRHGIARNLGDQRDVFPRGEARDEIVELENEADRVAAESRQLILVRAGEIVVRDSVSVPEVGTSRPPRLLSSVDFPLPDAPSSTTARRR